MNKKIIDPTICPVGHEHCTEISEPVMDFMPDYVYQLWYCHECQRTHEIEYRPITRTILRNEDLDEAIKDGD